MMRLSWAVVMAVGVGLLTAAVGCFRGGPAEEPATPDEVKALVDGNNEFAFDLYRKVAEKPDGNIVLSPYSISAALTMTYGGARGETAAEMARVLHLTLPPERVHPAQSALARSLRGDGKAGGAELLTANALWGQQGAPFEKAFVELTQRHYEGGWREVDFHHDPKVVAADINRWVAEQTRDKIPELLKDEDVQSLSTLVLVNAVYFKGLWDNPFEERLTTADAFKVTPDRTTPCRMMRGESHRVYYEGDGVKLVVLPYRGNTQSMVLILPDDANGLTPLEQGLSAAQVRRWIDAASPVEVQLSLPRFQARVGGKLRSTLGELGMERAFSTAADFTGILRRDRWQIGQVVHEAMVEVDERGAEAAAATAVIGRVPGSAKRPRIVTLRFDRPFLFLIQDRPTGQSLFVGRVADPLTTR